VSERALSAGGSGYEDFVGLLSVIAIELLQVTYLHRTQPDAPAQEILNPVQLKVLKAASPSKLPKILTVAWAVDCCLSGGYLEHRRKTPIGIQVLWRGWLKLHDLCEGWQLARATGKSKSVDKSTGQLVCGTVTVTSVSTSLAKCVFWVAFQQTAKRPTDEALPGTDTNRATTTVSRRPHGLAATGSSDIKRPDNRTSSDTDSR
jgi:hypothetical protein